MELSLVATGDTTGVNANETRFDITGTSTPDNLNIANQSYKVFVEGGNGSCVEPTTGDDNVSTFNF